MTLDPDGGLALRVQTLSKRYRLYRSPRGRLASLLWPSARVAVEHWALRELSFGVRRGTCMGVIGDNGAGKSTLLKLLAGTLAPTTGTVQVAGRATAILELGAGFHPDISGRDNLHFAGALIGLAPERLRALEASIIEFSELGEAVDRPVKTYSSGMLVRLAFALVTADEPDVLIVDEALAVGDQHFQKKCIDRIEAFRRRGCSILFCSHSLYQVRRLCDETLWLDRGQARAHGPTEAVVAAYEAHVRAQNGADAPARAPVAQAAQASLPTGQRGMLIEVTLDDLDSSVDPPLLRSPDLRVRLRARTVDEEPPAFGFMLELIDGPGITSVTSREDGARAQRAADGAWETTLLFPRLPLHSGRYTVSAYLFDADAVVEYDKWMHCGRFVFVAGTRLPGLVQLAHVWS